MSEPTKEQIAEVFNSLMSTARMYEGIYGSPTKMIIKVIDHWVRCSKELDEAQEEIEMLNIRYGAAEMHHDNNMEEVMKQRDEWGNLWADLSRACVKDTVKLEREIVRITEQRDTAIETIQKINYANNAHDEDSVAIYCDEFRKSLNQSTQ